MKLELHPEARAELRDAAIWYDEQQSGLGDDFISAIDSTLETLLALPQAAPRWPGIPPSIAIRRATVARFPYLIAYEIRGDTLCVLAVAHERRKPLYWLSRSE